MVCKHERLEILNNKRNLKITRCVECSIEFINGKQVSFEQFRKGIDIIVELTELESLIESLKVMKKKLESDIIFNYYKEKELLTEIEELK